MIFQVIYAYINSKKKDVRFISRLPILTIPIRSSKGVNKVQIIRQSSKNPLKPRLSRHPLNTAVATRRSTRMGEPKIRSFLSKEFYNVINKISKTEIVSGARDYRLMNRKMIDAVLEMSEYNRFSKGIFGWVGFRTKWLEYENIERSAGKTKWNVKKLFIYSLEGITGFSVVPLSIAAYMGVLFCGLSFLMIVAIVVRTLIWGDPVAGWPSMVCILFGVGGVQLLCTGILGQYLAKTYLEVKNRPVYLLKDSSKEEQRIMMMPLSQNLRRKSYGQG